MWVKGLFQGKPQGGPEGFHAADPAGGRRHSPSGEKAQATAWRTPTPSLFHSHDTEDYEDTEDDTQDHVDEIDRPQFRIADFAQSEPVFSVYRALGRDTTSLVSVH